MLQKRDKVKVYYFAKKFSNDVTLPKYLDYNAIFLYKKKSSFFLLNFKWYFFMSNN